MKIKLLLLIISSTLLQFCASNKAGVVDESSGLTAIDEMLGSEYETQKNDAETHVLAWKESGDKNAKLIKFAVFDLKKNEIVYEGTTLNGYVKWVDNATIEKRSMLGIDSPENQPNTVQINIIKETK